MIPEPTFLHVADVASEHPEPGPERDMAIAKYFAKWGADQELEACIELIKDHGWFANPEHRVNEVRAARRPKPPSLKEQALQALNDAVKMSDDDPPEGICSDQADIIRRALEQLSDHE